MISRNENPVFKFNEQFINKMDSLCDNGPQSHFRHCLHQDDSSPVHEMIIRHVPGAWVSPHFHIHKAESFVILSGKMRIYLFSKESLKITDVFDMQPGDSLKTVGLVHLDKGIVHSMEAIDRPAVFLEIVKGPFVKKGHLSNPKWYCDDKRDKLIEIMDEAAKTRGLKKINRKQ